MLMSEAIYPPKVHAFLTVGPSTNRQITIQVRGSIPGNMQSFGCLGCVALSRDWPRETLSHGKRPMLSLREKLLYHQIHPLKLAVDVTTSAVSTWLLWRHELLVGMLVGWIPSLAVTAAMLRWMDFSRQRDSRFGRYIAHHMTHRAEAVRFGGQFAMWFGAWFHSVGAIAAGAAVILLGWTYSLPFRRSHSQKKSSA